LRSLGGCAITESLEAVDGELGGREDTTQKICAAIDMAGVDSLRKTAEGRVCVFESRQKENPGNGEGEAALGNEEHFVEIVKVTISTDLTITPRQAV
jgi:hypothetical protein